MNYKIARMHKNTAVKLQNISKVYKLYNKPVDRLKESLHPLKKKYHKEFYALKNINLEIKKGEILGIVGVNGAGKSTLLKIISKVLTPTTGRVNINGRINAILELGSSLKPELTGRENIKLNLQINEISKDINQLTQEIIEFADIGEHIDQPVKSYSSGMKARLGFGIATSTDPDILIVDEVLAVGDVLFKRKCYSKIEKLFKDGKTVIFVSHSVQSVIEFCTRAVLLYDRELIMDDTPKKVTDYYQKIVFSKDKQKILDEINGKVEGKNKIEKKVLENQKNEKKKINLEVKKKGINKFYYSKSYYIDGLKTESKIVNNANIKLKNIYILNEKNEIVNKLITGNKYKIYCNIKNINLVNLTFGIAIQDIKGKSLSCSRELFNVEQREQLEFYWHFKCTLLNHKYFIKVDFRNGEEELYYQGTDILIFEVEKDRCKNCFVDLEQRLEIV
jgi:ABC-type polysaccharide/polyol phosphate transport system ATPase subunit